ncbi:MAG: hypothetical protein M0R28_08705 [Pigmentiphaga sp.]|nr:hypothetical protein [Pigmentiphaga sp.]
MCSPLRRGGPGLAVACTLAVLHGCGGDDDQNIQPMVPMAAATCAQTPVVTARSGYPVHDMRNRPIDEAAQCEVAAYYLAGYAILSSSDTDPWNAPDALATLKLPPSAPGRDSTYHAASRPASALEPGKPLKPAAAHRGFVYAKAPEGYGEPWLCVTPRLAPARLEQGLDDCLAGLRAAAANATHLTAEAATAPGQPGPKL